MFIHTNQPLITSFYIKKDNYRLPNQRRVSADPQFSAQRAREGYASHYISFFSKMVQYANLV